MTNPGIVVPQATHVEQRSDNPSGTRDKEIVFAFAIAFFVSFTFAHTLVEWILFRPLACGPQFTKGDARNGFRQQDGKQHYRNNSYDHSH